MIERILVVDDEPQVLQGIQRSLYNRVELQTAVGGMEGLRRIREDGPFALVISDMRMPEMSGTQFLSQVREYNPDIVRIMLSGQADLQATIEAVNEGHIYRFLSKPCASDQLLAAIEDGLKLYRLVTAEKVLLEQTVSGCVAMLIEILGMVSPAASSHATRLHKYVIGLASALQLDAHWQWRVAALVSQIGCVALPSELLLKIERMQPISDEERKLYESHAEVAAKLIASIPRMTEVADIVGAQFGILNFADKPDDLGQWDVKDLGSLLLRTANEFDRLMRSGMHRDAAILGLRTSQLGFPARVLDALRTMVLPSQERITRRLKIKDLAVGMVLDEDLVSPKGIRLVPAGHEVTRSLIVRLNSIASGVGVVEPFCVSVLS